MQPFSVKFNKSYQYKSGFMLIMSYNLLPLFKVNFIQTFQIILEREKFIINNYHYFYKEKDLQRLAWTCKDLHRLAKTCIDLHGLAWTCMDLLWLAWRLNKAFEAISKSILETWMIMIHFIIVKDLPRLTQICISLENTCIVISRWWNRI